MNLCRSTTLRILLLDWHCVITGRRRRGGGVRSLVAKFERRSATAETTGTSSSTYLGAKQQSRHVATFWLCSQTVGSRSENWKHFVFTLLFGQRLLPSQSFHVLPCRWCWQMLLPPQSLSQRLLLPQSLHIFLCRWCTHRAGALLGFFVEATASAISALAPLPMVLAQNRGVAGLLGWRSMWNRSYLQAWCIG